MIDVHIFYVVHSMYVHNFVIACDSRIQVTKCDSFLQMAIW